MKKIVFLLIAVLVFTALSCVAKSTNANLENGKRLFDQEDYDGAIRELTEAIRLDPNLAEGYAYRARSYNGKSDYDSAFTAIEVQGD